MSRITEELNGLKISEMYKVADINLKDELPIVQDSFNKKLTYQQLLNKTISSLNIPKLTSDLTNNSQTIAATANATNNLYNRLLTMRSELDIMINQINQQITNINNIITMGDIFIEWANIKNKPTNEELVGPQGPQGIAGPQGPQGPQGIQGLQGVAGTNGKDGINGIDGVDGIDGTGQYFHVKYSINSNGNPMTDTPSTYIGTYVGPERVAPTNYTVYTWFKWEGAQGPNGEQGIPGISGSDGTTYYLHIKYGIGYHPTTGVMQFTANNGEDPGPYLGQYVDSVQTDSSDPSRYTWAKIQGENGQDGAPGASPVTMYMGVYDSSTKYIGNANIRHIVKWNNGVDDFYYMTKVTTGEISNIPPSNSLYWEAFQGQFKNIATEFLFAEGANIGGWIFHNDGTNDMLRSQNNATILNGTTGTISAANSTFKVFESGNIGIQVPFNQNRAILVHDPSDSFDGSLAAYYDGAKQYSQISTSSFTSFDDKDSAGTGYRFKSQYYSSGFGISVAQNSGTVGPGTNAVAGIYIEPFNTMRLTTVLRGLPTSSSGLASGYVWNDNGTLKIV